MMCQIPRQPEKPGDFNPNDPPFFNSWRRGLAPKWFSIGILIYLILVTIVLMWMNYYWAYDDPFITYRYAQNLSEGQGFVYNPGERVLSTTTPLFAMLLAILSFVWNDYHHLAILVGACCLPAGGLFIWDLARSWKTPSLGWFALLVYPFFPLLRITLGSEMPLYLVFCLGALACYARGRYSLTGLFSALAVLTRPDALLVPAILALHYLFQERKTIPWKAIVIFLSLILPWVIFAWSYFGSPIPVTLATKQHQGLLPASQRFAPGLLTIVETNFATHGFYWFTTCLAFLGTVYAFIKNRSWLLVFVWSAAFFAAYSILGVSRYFWYYAVLVPSYLVAAGLGIACIYDIWLRIVRKSGFAYTDSAQKYQVFSFILSIPIIMGQLSLAWLSQTTVDYRYWLYRDIGIWIMQNTPENASVGMLEIGIIGYFSKRPIIDFAGLLQPDVAYQLRTDSGYIESAKWTINNYHPDYLVLQENIYPVLEENSIRQHCTAIKYYPGTDNDLHRSYALYVCKY